eukprot:3011678-Pleurochrysis_carterae.AAC.2
MSSFYLITRWARARCENATRSPLVRPKASAASKQAAPTMATATATATATLGQQAAPGRRKGRNKGPRSRSHAHAQALAAVAAAAAAAAAAARRRWRKVMANASARAASKRPARGERVQGGERVRAPVCHFGLSAICCWSEVSSETGACESNAASGWPTRATARARVRAGGELPFSHHWPWPPLLRMPDRTAMHGRRRACVHATKPSAKAGGRPRQKGPQS